MSTSSVVSSASALCGSHEGRAPRRADVDDLRLVLAEPEAQLALEDAVSCSFSCELRDDAALVEEHLRQHHPLGRDQPPRQVGLERLRQVVPAVVARLRSAAPRGDPLVDLRVVDEAERERRVRAAAVREEERRDDRDAVLDRPLRQADGVDEPGESRPQAASTASPPAASARAPPASARPCAGRARDRASCSSIQPRRADSSKSRCPRAPAHWSVSLAATSRRRSRPGRRPSRAARRGRTSSRSYRPDDDVGAEAPEARQRLVGEAELAVGDVLDDQEAVAARQLDQRRRRSAARLTPAGFW